MLQKIINFIKYHNAFTLIFVVCFFGGGIVFAASPEARNSVYAAEETTVSVDNGLIVSTDLDNFGFNLRIDSITEDLKNYYAAYTYRTLTILDGVWQRKEISKTLAVSKEALGDSDLGLYVAKELGENINYELSYLKKVQALEREKGESQKIITVTYSGLVGRLLDPKTEVIEGYSPVIPEPPSEVADELNPAASADAAPYYEPENESDSVVTPPQSEPTAPREEEPAPVVVPPPVEPTPEPAPETVSTSTPPQPEPAVEPEPEVISPPVEPTPEPVVEATSTPESAQ